MSNGNSGLSLPSYVLSLVIPGTPLAPAAAGWKAALIKRVGNDVLGVGPQPQIVGADLNDVADQLIARHTERTNVA